MIGRRAARGAAVIVLACVHGLESRSIGQEEDLKALSSDFLSEAGAKPIDCGMGIDFASFAHVECGQITVPITDFKRQVHEELMSRGWAINVGWQTGSLYEKPTINMTGSSNRGALFSVDVRWPSEELPITVFLLWTKLSFEADSSMILPERVSFVKPEYPLKARKEGKEGMVILEILVDTAGNVARTRLLKSDPDFDEAAIESVRRWKYKPARADGKAVSDHLMVNMHFNL